jgi:hypothetical protein
VHAQRSVPVDTTKPKGEKPFNPADTVAAAITSKRITPGRAFVRSMLIPGWGQFSTGATARGAVYATLQGASAIMLGKTMFKLSDARNEVNARRQTASDSLVAFAATLKDTALIRRYSNKDSLNVDVEKQFGVIDKESLVKARTSQRQDWITYLLFFTFASGVDAFVGAHLADFPGSVTVEPAQAGGTQLRVDWRFGGRPPARARVEPVPGIR